MCGYIEDMTHSTIAFKEQSMSAQQQTCDMFFCPEKVVNSLTASPEAA